MSYAAVTTAVLALDQVTKYWVWSRFRLGEIVAVVPGLFNLRYVRNDGAALGLFSGYRWPLIAVSVGMLTLLWRHRADFRGGGAVGRWSLGLLLGGIAGNLIDRLRFGYVVDFFDFYWRARHFPAFNIADAAICMGVALYAWSSYRCSVTGSAAPGGCDAPAAPGG